MPRFAALAALALIWATAGCFNVKYGHCRITCSDTEACPSSLECVMEPGRFNGVCAARGTQPSECFPDSVDAGGDTDAIDAGDDTGDAMDAGTDATDGPAGPPEVLCHNGTCLTLPQAIRANLVLLLWPSNLPPVGAMVSVWTDQSGYGNDAKAQYQTALPQVVPNGVHLDPNHLGSGFVVASSPSLDFGSGDFAILVVAGLSSSTTPLSIMRKSDGARENSRQISIDWVRTASDTGEPRAAVNDDVVVTGANILQPSVGAYTLQRATDHVELHLNGTVLGSADLQTPGASTSNAADVYVGVAGIVGSPVDSIAAVIAIRGSVGSSDLNQLETFLRTLFAATP